MNIEGKILVDRIATELVVDECHNLKSAMGSDAMVLMYLNHMCVCIFYCYP